MQAAQPSENQMVTPPAYFFLPDLPGKSVIDILQGGRRSAKMQTATGRSRSIPHVAQSGSCGAA
ncbi:MAG: hypothetical protein LUH13_01500 [Oscillospiraceae bacterium]|nr:hypothetical protein [Oscillospiraceae bacterium]